MSCLRAFGHCAVLILLMSGPGGCAREANHPDEEQEAHFQKGRTLADSQDFKEAAEEFEKALETNPGSAAAHFELGWLYDTKLNDYAAAIYHYDRLLQLQPESERAALVKERIRGCKHELANSEFPLPNSRNLQREVDRLNAENLLLKNNWKRSKINSPPRGSCPARVEPLRVCRHRCRASRKPRAHRFSRSGPASACAYRQSA